MKIVVINGQTREAAAEDVAALLAELGFASGTVLVEQNGTALRPSEWSQRSIRNGDQFELLRIAAGG